MSKRALVASRALALLPERARLGPDESLVGRLVRWQRALLLPPAVVVAVLLARPPGVVLPLPVAVVVSRGMRRRGVLSLGKRREVIRPAVVMLGLL